MHSRSGSAQYTTAMSLAHNASKWRAIHDPVDDSVVLSAIPVSQGGEARAWQSACRSAAEGERGSAAVAVTGGLAQQRTRDNVGEIGAAAQRQIARVIVVGA